MIIATDKSTLVSFSVTFSLSDPEADRKSKLCETTSSEFADFSLTNDLLTHRMFQSRK